MTAPRELPKPIAAAADLPGRGRCLMADLPVMPDTVPLKPCGCGAIEGDVCDCAEFLAELFAAPVYTLPTTAQIGATS